MRTTTSIAKIIGYSCLALALVAVLAFGALAFVLKDSLSMTGGSCKTVFADLKSDNPQIQAQARRFMEAAVRRVKGLDKSRAIDGLLYSQTVHSLSQFCDTHSTDNLLQLQIDYLGLRN